ncbi:MAG: hypothetical protein WCL70_05280 [Paludibacter sp.]
MKLKNAFFLFLSIFLISNNIANAQEPTCDGVDTTHWKRINTIPINSGCVDVKYYKRNSTSLIGFYKYFKKANRSECEGLKSIDFGKYNLITFWSTAGGCKQPNVKFALFNNGTKTPFLKISITQFGTCKVSRGVVYYCLVLKKLCPKEPKVCITRKIIEEKRL